jgi:hypothetical protein
MIDWHLGPHNPFDGIVNLDEEDSKSVTDFIGDCESADGRHGSAGDRYSMKIVPTGLGPLIEVNDPITGKQLTIFDGDASVKQRRSPEDEED